MPVPTLFQRPPAQAVHMGLKDKLSFFDQEGSGALASFRGKGMGHGEHY